VRRASLIESLDGRVAAGERPALITVKLVQLIPVRRGLVCWPRLTLQLGLSLRVPLRLRYPLAQFSILRPSTL
jgi:hypothetical protein